ncbi:MAG: DUF3575 domain-containing protein [Bacteroidota bacterium]
MRLIVLLLLILLPKLIFAQNIYFGSNLAPYIYSCYNFYIENYFNNKISIIISSGYRKDNNPYKGYYNKPEGNFYSQSTNIGFGSRLFFSNREKIDAFIGLNLILAWYDEFLISADIEHFYGKFLEKEQVKGTLFGVGISPGITWKILNRLNLNFGLQLGFTKERNDSYLDQYYITGLGFKPPGHGMGFSSENLSIQAIIEIKYNLIRLNRIEKKESD